MVTVERAVVPVYTSVGTTRSKPDTHEWRECLSPLTKEQGRECAFAGTQGETISVDCLMKSWGLDVLKSLFLLNDCHNRGSSLKCLSECSAV